MENGEQSEGDREDQLSATVDKRKRLQARPPFVSSAPSCGRYASPRVGGLTDQMVALGEVRGKAGRNGVRRCGSREVPVELMQVTADGVPTVSLAEYVVQPIGFAQTGRAAEDVADRHRAPEHRGRILAYGMLGKGDEVVVPGEDLGPVGLLRTCRVVMQGSDGGLHLIATGAIRGQR